MGGTFDPPHKAHIAMARAAQREFSLDKVIFMTGGNPPHKTTNTDAKIRHHMVKLSIADHSDFVPCDYEINRETYSYTSDTLRYLTQTYGQDEFYFIIGGDSFEAIFTWHEPEEILKRCVLLVYPREGVPNEEDVQTFSAKHGADVRILHAEGIAVSSTQIREMAEGGIDFSAYVEPEVCHYIKRNRLYLKKEESDEAVLKKMLTPKRYQHSIGVAASAVMLAGLYKEDAGKAYLAGLLHDCAKDLSVEESEQKCIDFEIELDEVEQENHGLQHAKIGAEMVKTLFRVTDPDICNSIRWHTLGRVGMGTLEKIIFVADMIEPNRIYPEAAFLRNAACHDLDTAVLECIDAIIKFNEDKGRPIHPNAYEVRDWLLKSGVRPLENDGKMLNNHNDF